MRFDGSKLGGLDPQAQLVQLQRAVRSGVLTAPAAAELAAQHGLDESHQAAIADTRFSGLAYAQRQISNVLSGPGRLPKTSPLFRGLLSSTLAAGTEVVDFGDHGGVKVPAPIAQRINERLAYLADPASDDPQLHEELQHTNCRGATAAVLFGAAGKANWSLSDKQITTQVQHKVYGSQQELEAQLRQCASPAVLMLGPHESHTVTFLGFDSEGQGIVFHKGNLGTNYPWELISLDNLFEQYCTPDYYGHEQGLRIAQPNLQGP